ncbi:hypothetical protein LTR28_008324, partial [Elasticomyces elasticus]
MSLLDPTVFSGTGVTRMALTAGKNGKIYVLNADNLGGYKQGTGGVDLILQTIVTSQAVFGGAGSYPLEGGYIYYTPVGHQTFAYKLGHDASGVPQFISAGQSNEVSAGRVGVGVPTVTSYKGKAGSGIVWMTFFTGDSMQSLMPRDRTLMLVFERDSNGNLYCLGSPVNLPLNCTSVDFGEVSIGSAKTSNVTCTAVINLNSIDGMTVGDARFEVSNATLP